MSIYDMRLAMSGGTLHHIGLMLEREEAEAARGDAARAIVPVVRCAWCDSEAGRKPNPDRAESHGICARHLALQRAALDELRRQCR